MPLFAGLLLLWLSSILLRGFVRANPTVLSRQMRQGGGWLALVVAIAMMFRGEFNVAFAAAGFGFWLLGTRPGWMKTQFANVGWGAGRNGAGASSAVSKVRTAAVEMVLNSATGHITGRFIAGPAAGQALDGLSQADCVQLYRWCQGADPQGARLLETYFDRRFAGWRAADDAGDDTGRAQAGFHRQRPSQMSDREAYEVLGLAQGAGRDEITRAHRRLMKTYHPDHGGSTDMAARVNEAKDVLMGRHP